MNRFWEFAQENPLIVLGIVFCITAALVKIITGSDF